MPIGWLPCLRRPDGIGGRDIPRLTRIMTLADAYDAMTSERPYRRALTAESALTEIERCRDAQFDPEITDVFLEVMNNRVAAGIAVMDQEATSNCKLQPVK